jgi:hypothetical protein
VANEILDPVSGRNDNETLERILQIVARGLKGQSGNGIRIAATKDTHTTAANEFSSADTTNGIGMDFYSQNGTYRVRAQNSGLLIDGAPTLNALTVGSVLFVGASKVLSEDNTNFFWDDAANTLKALNLIVPTKAAVGASALGSEVLTVTGNARVSTFLGVGGAPSATIQLLVTGTANVTGNFTVNTDKFVVTASNGNVAFLGDLAINTDKFTVAASSGNTLIAGTATITGNIVHDTSLIATLVASDKIGLGVIPVSTSAMVEAAGAVMVTNSTGTSTTSAGLEFRYASGTTGEIRAIDRSTTTFKNLDIYALAGTLRTGGTKRVEWDGTGLGFFAETPVAQQASPGQVDSTGVDATYGNTERDLLLALTLAVNAHTDALEAYGLEA